MNSSAHFRTPINIALIKYWGKRDEKAMLPLNDSISVTINALWADTLVEVTEGEERDSLSINGDVSELSERHKRVIAQFRDDLKRLGRTVLLGKSLRITSKTNFPVASGLASSAAGFAVLAECLAALGNLDSERKMELARLGSGSAVRSTLPGFVHWHASDGSCSQIKCEWPQLMAVVLVVTDSAKETPSTAGMKRSVETSELLQYRVSNTVPNRVSQLLGALETKDFENFAHAVMKDSNELHAVCADTYPPLYYMNDTSRQIVALVHKLNEVKVRFAYSFDAGPHATVFTLKNNVDVLIEELRCVFGDFPVNRDGEPMNLVCEKTLLAVVSSVGSGSVKL